jgi:hypothetical protein
MSHELHRACIEACNACADACDHCAAACLREPEVQKMVDCIALDIDCAALCRLTPAFMARGSANAGALCDVCARLCDACADECGRHRMDHCQRCAEACRRCAAECRKMAA